VYFSQVRGDKPPPTIFFTSGLSVTLSTIQTGKSPMVGLIHFLKAPWMEVGSWMGLRVVASCMAGEPLGLETARDLFLQVRHAYTELVVEFS
jgi:hypothetical protein